ncbi:MAG: CoA-transferase [Gaiellaceae bacterium]
MSYRSEELLITVVARWLEGAGHVAVGAVSPIPAAGALLAATRSDGGMRVSLLGSARYSSFTEGGRELFDCAAQGRIDAFFLGGLQIDGSANINLVGLGPYPKSDLRLAGSFGSAYMYFLVPRVMLFALEHTTRTLVERVDFISAPGTSPPGVYRPGGPVALLTERCLFDFDRRSARFRLVSVHPGQTLADVVDNTGFDFDHPAEVPETPIPDAGELALIREQIGQAVAETYPAFAERVLGVAA